MPPHLTPSRPAPCTCAATLRARAILCAPPPPWWPPRTATAASPRTRHGAGPLT